MNVLQVIPSVSVVHGGPSQAIVTIEKALCALGVKITTLTTDDDGPGRRLAPKEQPLTMNGAKRIYARKRTEFYKVAPGLVAWLWRHVHEFDVVHIHALFSFSSLAAGIIARLRGVPYVIRPLGTLTIYGVKKRRPWLKRISLLAMEGPILKRASVVHFTSSLEKAEAESIGIRFNSVVIPLGVEAASIGLVENKHRLEVQTSGVRKVLFLSRIDPKKNIEGLVRAMAIVKSRGINASLMIAGNGPPYYVSALKALVVSLGIEDNVQWLGHVSGTSKSAAFADASLFVLPSFSENFGIAVVEAMLAGLPCILTEGVAMAREVADVGAGLITSCEPPSIASALMEMIEDDVLRQHAGEVAKRFAQHEYAVERMGERLLALYESLETGEIR